MNQKNKISHSCCHLSTHFTDPFTSPFHASTFHPPYSTPALRFTLSHSTLYPSHHHSTIQHSTPHIPIHASPIHASTFHHSRIPLIIFYGLLDTLQSIHRPTQSTYTFHVYFPRKLIIPRNHFHVRTPFHVMMLSRDLLHHTSNRDRLCQPRSSDISGPRSAAQHP